MVQKRSYGVNLGAKSIKIGLEQKTKFMPLNLRTKLGSRVVVKKKLTYVETKSEIKWDLTQGVSMILGLKFSMDGWAFLCGLKIGGVRLVFPVVITIPGQAATVEGT